METQELKFIELITKDGENHLGKSEFFPQALNQLAKLTTANFVALVTIFPDKYNQELQLNSVISQHQKNSAFKHRLSITDLPSALKPLSARNKVLDIELNTLLNAILSTEQLSDLSDIKNTTIEVSAMLKNDDLVGLVCIEKTHPENFWQRFPASSQVLKTLFTQHQALMRSQIEQSTYQKILDLMPQRVFWKNRDSVYLGCNKAFSEDASMPSTEDIIGKTDFDVFPDQAELYRNDDANTMNTREHLICSEEPQTHDSGATIWLRTSKRPIISHEDTVIGIVGTYDDITQLKDTQEQLHLATVELEKRVEERTESLSTSNRLLEKAIQDLTSAQNHLVETEKMAALGNLVAGIAHEINTPIGVSVTAASHLEETARLLAKDVEQGTISKQRFIQDSQELQDSSQLILHNLSRASELIQNFKMIAVDQTYDEKRPLEFKQYLGDVIHAMTPQLKKKHVLTELIGDEDIHIETYPGTVAQIITNLISNSIEHAFTESSQGLIKITFERSESGVLLTFEDNGEGIEKSKLTKIFEPFYTSKRGQGGSGLGLSIVYNLITQKLKGKVSCLSQKGEWTKFTLNFPVD